MRVRFADPPASAERDMRSCRVSEAPTNAVSSNSSGDVDTGDNRAVSSGINGVRSLRVGSVRHRTPNDRGDALRRKYREPRLQAS